MEAIQFLTGWIGYMLVLLPVGAGFSVTYQSGRKSLTEDPGVMEDANKKIKNTIKATIIGMTISGFITAVKAFYV